MALTELKTSRHAKGGLADKRKFYVIAGRGFAAILNHVALLRDGSRVDGRPILHIGEPDPWRRRRQMAMGQWPHLLSLPGFSERPEFESTEERDFFPSKKFAAYLARQEQRLEGYFLEGKIVHAEWNGGAYEVAASTGAGEIRVLAERIDLCSGAGPIARLGPEVAIEPQLAAEYAGAVPDGRAWRGIVSGEDFVMEGVSQPSDGLVCVYGGGGTAAWCVEASLAAGNDVFWVSRDSLSGAFVPSGRNDRLGRFERGPAPSWTVGPVTPSPEHRLTIAEGYTVASASSAPDGRLSVRFRAGGNEKWAPRHLSPGGGDRGELSEITCVQLVAAIGRASSAPGSMVDVMRQFVPLAAPGSGAKRHAIFAPCGRLAGLRSLDGAVRFLGVAADAHPLTAQICQDERIGAARDRYRRFVRPGEVLERRRRGSRSSAHTCRRERYRRSQWAFVCLDEPKHQYDVPRAAPPVLAGAGLGRSPHRRWISTPEQWSAFGFRPGNEPDLGFGAGD